MNNLLSYCGLVDPRISASEKDLPVRVTLKISIFYGPIRSKYFTSVGVENPFFT